MLNEITLFGTKNRSVHEIAGRTRADHIILNNDNDMRRKLSEICLIQQKLVLNPIVDWSDQDVWDFIKDRNLPVNPLDTQGYSRVGCIGCPISKNGRKKLDKTPEYRTGTPISGRLNGISKQGKPVDCRKSQFLRHRKFTLTGG